MVVPLPSGVTPVSIAGGGGTGYAIGSDGHLYAWGLNGSGQLGNGTTTNSTTPVVVSMPSGVHATTVAGGGGFAYAIGSDGHEYAWGNDTAGQLGNGGTTNSSLPVVVALPSGVTPESISGSYFSGYAIGSDGKLYAWGGNGVGELGDGTTTNSSTPVAVTLPAGSTAQQLGPEPGSESGYAIVTSPNTAPTIATQPTSQTVTAGASASFTATAGGFPSPTVQWETLHRRRNHLCTRQRFNQWHADSPLHRAERKRQPISGRVHQSGGSATTARPHSRSPPGRTDRRHPAHRPERRSRADRHLHCGSQR